MASYTRHNDAAEIVASLLILSAIRGGRKIFFSLLIRLRWKISLIKLRRSPITTPQHAEKVLHIHWIIWRSSAIILLILCTQCTATSAGGAKLTRFDRSLKQGNSFHDMPPLPRIIQQCTQSYTFQVFYKLLLLARLDRQVGSEYFWNFEKCSTFEDSFSYFHGQSEYYVRVTAHWN